MKKCSTFFPIYGTSVEKVRRMKLFLTISVIIRRFSIVLTYFKTGRNPFKARPFSICDRVFLPKKETCLLAFLFQKCFKIVIIFIIRLFKSRSVIF